MAITKRYLFPLKCPNEEEDEMAYGPKQEPSKNTVTFLDFRTDDVFFITKQEYQCINFDKHETA